MERTERLGSERVTAAVDHRVATERRQRPKSAKYRGELRRLSVSAADEDDVFAADIAAPRRRPKPAAVRRPRVSAAELDSGCEDDVEIEVLYLDERYAGSSESSAGGGKEEAGGAALVSAWDEAPPGSHCKRATDVLKLDVGWYNRCCEQERRAQHDQRIELGALRKLPPPAYADAAGAPTNAATRRRVVSDSDKRRKANGGGGGGGEGARGPLLQRQNSCGNTSIGQLVKDVACGQVAENVLTRYRRRAVSDVSSCPAAPALTAPPSSTDLTRPAPPSKLKPLYPRAATDDQLTTLFCTQLPRALSLKARQVRRGSMQDNGSVTHRKLSD